MTQVLEVIKKTKKRDIRRFSCPSAVISLHLLRGPQDSRPWKRFRGERTPISGSLERLKPFSFPLNVHFPRTNSWCASHMRILNTWCLYRRIEATLFTRDGWSSVARVPCARTKNEELLPTSKTSEHGAQAATTA